MTRAPLLIAAGLAVWAVQMIWIPFHAAGVINGIGHFWGYRNYDAPDASTNIVPWGIWIGGEELHNNHHTYPTSAKLSSKWYEFDLGWTYIRLLQSVGLARVLRLAPQPQVAEPKRAVDGETLQALIANRYDLLAKYARNLTSAYRAELGSLELHEAERARFASLQRWLRKGDVAALPAEEQRSLRDLMARSCVMKTLVEMRTELASIWEKSSASREQMLVQLQDWIARAEASRIRALEEAAAGVPGIDKAGHRVRQRWTDSIEYRCREQEPAHVVGGDVDDFGGDVVGEGPVASGDLRQPIRTGVVAEDDRGQLKTGRPTFAAVQQPLQLIVGEVVDPLRPEQCRGLTRIEPKVLLTDLGEAPIGAHAGPRKRWVSPGHNDQP
jgi:hypothetical protein